jgi:flavin-binding protein dodecin
MPGGFRQGPSCDGLLKRIRRQERSQKAMAVAKVTEITASSTKSFEDALRAGIARAEKTLKNIKSAWIQEQKVKIERGKITEFRVNMKVTFVLKD